MKTGLKNQHREVLLCRYQQESLNQELNLFADVMYQFPESVL